jgi:hypothetical protein
MGNRVSRLRIYRGSGSRSLLFGDLIFSSSSLRIHAGITAAGFSRTLVAEG